MVHVTGRSLARIALLIGVLVAAAPAAPAEAASRTFSGQEQGGVISFRVAHLGDVRVHRAVVQRGSRCLPLSVRDVGAALRGQAGVRVRAQGRGWKRSCPKARSAVRRTSSSRTRAARRAKRSRTRAARRAKRSRSRRSGSRRTSRRSASRRSRPRLIVTYTPRRGVTGGGGRSKPSKPSKVLPVPAPDLVEAADPVAAPDPVGSAPAPAPAPAPVEDPLPTISVCSPVDELYGPGNWPSGCWRPYADDSPFNRPIPANPTVHPESGRYVRQLASHGGPQAIPAGSADTSSDWAHPTYYSRPDDPEFTVHCERTWGTCAIEGMRIRIPDAARPAAGGDGHMTVVDQASGWEYDFWKVSSKPAGGGTITIAWGGRTRIDGDGLGSDATAARYGNLAGMIRGPELQAGEIRHALFLTFPCDAGSAVYPALKNGRSCTDAGMPSEDAFPMGTRFQLAMSDAEIDALGLPAWKRTIVRAMARYGMYFGDTGGRSWAVMAESGSTYTSFGYEDPLVAVARDAGIPASSTSGIRWMDVAGAVDWSRLRALDPCTARGTC